MLYSFVMLISSNTFQQHLLVSWLKKKIFVFSISQDFFTFSAKLTRTNLVISIIRIRYLNKANLIFFFESDYVQFYECFSKSNFLIEKFCRQRLRRGVQYQVCMCRQQQTFQIEDQCIFHSSNSKFVHPIIIAANAAMYICVYYVVLQYTTSLGMYKESWSRVPSCAKMESRQITGRTTPNNWLKARHLPFYNTHLKGRNLNLAFLPR